MPNFYTVEHVRKIVDSKETENYLIIKRIAGKEYVEEMTINLNSIFGKHKLQELIKSLQKHL